MAKGVKAKRRETTPWCTSTLWEFAWRETEEQCRNLSLSFQKWTGTSRPQWPVCRSLSHKTHKQTELNSPRKVLTLTAWPYRWRRYDPRNVGNCDHSTRRHIAGDFSIQLSAPSVFMKQLENRCASLGGIWYWGDELYFVDPFPFFFKIIHK